MLGTGQLALCLTDAMLYAVELMRQSTDQKPVGLLTSKDRLPTEEAARPLTLPAGKWTRYSKRPVYKRRRRAACLILVVALAGPLFLGQASNGVLDRVAPPSIGLAPELMSEDPADVEEATGEDVVAAPDDPTLYLTVPRLGLYNHTVRNDNSEAALELGAIKLPRAGFPWEEGTNTYIACHRLGFPGTESFNQCLNLPSMQKGDSIFLQDASGRAYEYRMTETLIIDPHDVWVTHPVADKDIVSLQTCIETPDDLYTLGPNWEARFVVRAERAKEGPLTSLNQPRQPTATPKPSFHL